MQIVIAWLEDEQEIVKLGRTDVGEMHKFRTVQKPRACMWLNDGNASDAEKAAAYASSEGKSVFCYTGENNPLDRARRDVSA